MKNGPPAQAPVVSDEALKEAMKKADGVTRDYLSVSVLGKVVEEVLTEQKSMDSKLSGIIGCVMSKVYPASKIALRVVDSTSCRVHE